MAAPVLAAVTPFVARVRATSTPIAARGNEGEWPLVHELSIAISLVEAACEELPKLGRGAAIAAVHVRIGPLAGVVAEALQFSFDVAAAGSPIEGARLDVELVPVVVWCSHCQCERRIHAVPTLRCPACGSPTPVVIRGRELELAALEVLGGEDR